MYAFIHVRALDNTCIIERCEFYFDTRSFSFQNNRDITSSYIKIFDLFFKLKILFGIRLMRLALFKYPKIYKKYYMKLFVMNLLYCNFF